jgi:hypothetical protein
MLAESARLRRADQSLREGREQRRAAAINLLPTVGVAVPRWLLWKPLVTHSASGRFFDHTVAVPNDVALLGTAAFFQALVLAPSNTVVTQSIAGYDTVFTACRRSSTSRCV